MFMHDDKKKQATLIVSHLKKTMEPKPTNESGDEVDFTAAYQSAASDVLKAIHAHDVKSLVNALKDFIAVCESEEHYEEEEPGDSPEEEASEQE